MREATLKEGGAIASRKVELILCVADGAYMNNSSYDAFQDG